MQMHAPERSYILWFSQRVGSTVLGRALEDTGVAGRPREWFNAATAEAVLATHGVSNADELRDSLWREGTTDNGVLGLKYSLHPPQHAEISGLLGPLGWQRFFPGCRHFLLTRRDKVRLAVSWWRAIQSNEWHRAVGAPPRVRDFAGAYDRRAIAHLVAEANVREGAILDQLAAWRVTPTTIVYEDAMTSFEPTIRSILDVIGIPHRDVAIPAPALEKLSDEVSEAWYARFTTEA
jgi:LPS sulfotransferase NodH